MTKSDQVRVFFDGEDISDQVLSVDVHQGLKGPGVQVFPRPGSSLNPYPRSIKVYVGKILIYVTSPDYDGRQPMRLVPGTLNGLTAQAPETEEGGN